MALEEEVDLDFGEEAIDLDVLAPDALRGSRGAVLTPGHALALGHALYEVGNGNRTAELIADAYGLQLAEVAQLLPMPCRPLFTRYGPATPWPEDRRAGERKDAKAAKPEPVRGTVFVAGSIEPLATEPPAVGNMRAKAPGWDGRVTWGRALVVTRSLRPAGEGEEKGHFETELIDSFSVALRLECEGHTAYAYWTRPVEGGISWKYADGGLDGVNGIKVRALEAVLKAR